MYDSLLFLVLACSICFVLPPRGAAAGSMTWVLKPSNGRAMTLQDGTGDAEKFYLDHAVGIPPGDGISEAGRVDWGKTLLQGEEGAVLLRVGIQDPEKGDLILKRKSRRGISAQLGNDSKTAVLTAFVFRGDEKSVQAGDLGLNDPSDRIVGARLLLEPGGGEAVPFRGSASVISGPGGGAWSFAGETKTPGPFHLEAEVAGTSAPGEGPGSDLALQGKLSTESQMHPAPVNCRLSLAWRRVGARFESPAFPGQQNNTQSTRLQAKLSWWAFGLEADASKKGDNVDQLPGLPTVEVWHTSLDLTLHSGELLPEGTWPFFLKHSSWHIYHATTCRRTTPWGGDDVAEGDQSVLGLGLRCGSAPCSWELDWNLSTREDIAQGGRQTQQVGLKTFLGSPSFQINPFFRLSTTGGTDGEESRGMTTGLAGLFQPETPWKGDVDFSMSRQESPETWNESFRIRGRVGWSGAGARVGKPGVEVFLDGSFRAITTGSEEEDQGNEECSVRLSVKVPLWS